MASLKYGKTASLQTVTLGSSYTSGSGSMSLTSGHGARLPSSGDFWLTYDDGAGTVRIFKVTARSTDTLTVTAESSEGSGDGSISSGSTLRWAMTCGALDQLRQDICGYGTYANLPATCKTGDQYKTSDSIYEFLATATDTWTAFNCSKKVVVPPASGWSWNGNQGSATVDYTYGYGYLYAPSNSGDSLRAQVRSTSAPYVVTARVRVQHYQSNYTSAGIVFRDSATDKHVVFGLGSNGGQNLLSYYHSTATAAGSGRGTFISLTNINEIWLRGSDDNTNRILEYSLDGNNWIQYSSSTRTTDLTANQIGWFANSNNSNRVDAMLISWNVT